MFTLRDFLIGSGMVVAGVLMVRYAFWLRNMTGPQQWLENITGAGTTYGMYKVFGVLVAFLGFMWASGLGNAVLGFFLTPFIHTFGGISGAGSTPTPPLQ